MQIPDINPKHIPDLATHQVVIQLLNVIETLAAENAALRGEIQNLRDENARLKGRSDTPDIKPPMPPTPPPADHSSPNLADRVVQRTGISVPSAA